MELNVYFKSIVEQDPCAVVLCDLDHKIIYMNPSAIDRYAKRGGRALLGKSLLDCHNRDSAEKINNVLAWFAASEQHNRLFTYHNPKENIDVYMVALRDDVGALIGYYEKHEYRNSDPSMPYIMD